MSKQDAGLPVLKETTFSAVAEQMLHRHFSDPLGVTQLDQYTLIGSKVY